MLPRRAAWLVGLLMMLAPTAHVIAAPGAFDPTFGTGGSITLALSSGQDTGFAVAVQPDGRIVVAGTKNGQGVLLRLDEAGALDPTFGTGGLAYSSISGAFIALALEPDGRIVAFGTDAALERFDAHGARDAGFVAVPLPIDAQISDDSADLFRLADGSFIATGRSTLDQTLALVRVLGDGTLDFTFGVMGLAEAPLVGTDRDMATAVAQQADGKLVVAGQATTSGLDDLALARFTSAGVIDTSFGTAGTVHVVVTPGSHFHTHAVAVTTGGRILVFGTDGGGPASYVLLAFLPSGAPDTGFGVGGKVVATPGLSNFGGDMVVQPEGGIVIFGSTDSHDRLLRFHADGTPDPTFGVAGVADVGIGGCCNNAYGLARTSDGRLVGVGQRAGGATFFDLTVLRALGMQCGNGVVEDEEQCDDGNIANEDCCSSTCTLDVPGSGCTDDGFACTDDTCDGSGTCTHTPRVRPFCRHTTRPEKATLLLRHKPGGMKDTLAWKVTRGEAVGLGELGNPLANTDYVLCGFDTSGSAGGAFLFELTAPAGGMCGTKPCWAVAGSGFKYKDRDRTPDGMDHVKALAGPDGKAMFAAAGKGGTLALPQLPLPLPVRVQLQVEGGPCVEATYQSAIHNDGAQFKARGD